MANSTIRPVEELVRRRNIKGAIWRHTNDDGKPYYSLGITRSRKDSKGAWHDKTLYLSVDDIPKVVALLKEGETEIYQRITQDYAEQEAA